MASSSSPSANAPEVDQLLELADQLDVTVGRINALTDGGSVERRDEIELQQAALWLLSWLALGLWAFAAIRGRQLDKRLKELGK